MWVLAAVLLSSLEEKFWVQCQTLFTNIKLSFISFNQLASADGENKSTDNVEQSVTHERTALPFTYPGYKIWSNVLWLIAFSYFIALDNKYEAMPLVVA